MNLQFSRVTICNFLSYGRSEIDLKDKGYCLVSGINYDKRDNSASNGSGKSSWSSAICWALTGETIQGISTHIKNDNIDEKECWVKLEFKADKDEYEITRYNEPKSDLKIKLNGTDISGKGIRESEIILAQHLPDLTSSLIASIIILGQGLPNKFSSNKPSGRKEVLEKLSKSDFMIEDLKNRLRDRATLLNSSLREVEDTLLIKSTKKDTVESDIKRYELKLEELNKIADLTAEIEELNKIIIVQENLVKQRDLDISNKNVEYGQINDKLNILLTEKTKDLEEDNIDFNNYYSDYLTQKTNLESDIRSVKKVIADKKSITDICPTCGQKIIGIVKPSTVEDEKQLDEKTKHLTNLNEAYVSQSKKHEEEKQKIENKYKIQIDDLNKSLNQVKKDLAELYSNKGPDLSELRAKKVKLETEKKNHADNIKQVTDSLNDAKSTLKSLQDEILYNNSEKENLNSHLDIINKMSTLVKRDFRGVLLSNVISFINEKSKEYAAELFGTSELDFKLDGNNIDIAYCNKPFENLSGGEKQKVDLIIQFAIRDMMSQYLNFSSNILVLDEVFDNLDTVCCMNVINFISKRLTDIESIFIISHHADELQIPADSEMVIVKDENGVSKIK